MSAPSRLARIRRLTVPALLALVTVLLWCTAYARWTAAAWRVPVDYSGDSLEVLARIKAASESDLAPFSRHQVARLGAPFGADWSEYPGSDAWANFALGQLARLTGVPVAANLAVLLAHLTAVLAFYGCARVVRIPRLWSALGSLLFGFSYFAFNRGLTHLWVAYSWQVPFTLLICWLLAGSRVLLRRPAMRWLALLVAAAIGASNPYNLYLFLQLAAWATLAGWLRLRSAANVRLGLACIGVALAMFVLSYLQVWVYAQDEQGQPLLARNYAGTEMYALKPIELVLPPADHRAAAPAALGHRYLRWSDWRGEYFSPYLGVIGACSLAALLGLLALRLVSRRRSAIPGGGLMALWILLFAGVGGLNSIVAFYGGLNLFRATNRFSIFLLALALFFLVSQLARASRPWPPAIRWALAALLLGFGLWDQIPRIEADRRTADHGKLVAADAVLGAQLERQLGAHAAVFKLPVMEFPEGSPRHRVLAYDQFRLFLATDTLRFSFGSRKQRARGRWQRDYERLPPAELVRALERAGFSALLINRNGFPDDAGALTQALAAAGRPVTMVDPAGHRLVVPLRPSPSPAPPLASAPTFGRGWLRGTRGDDESVRVANGPATLSYFNPRNEPLLVRARFRLSAPIACSITLTLNDVPAGSAEVTTAPQEFAFALELPPGLSRLELTSDADPVRLHQGRGGLRSFQLSGLTWSLPPGG